MQVFVLYSLWCWCIPGKKTKQNMISAIQPHPQKHSPSLVPALYTTALPFVIDEDEGFPLSETPKSKSAQVQFLPPPPPLRQTDRPQPVPSFEVAGARALKPLLKAPAVSTSVFHPTLTNPHLPPTPRPILPPPSSGPSRNPL